MTYFWFLTVLAAASGNVLPNAPNSLDPRLTDGIIAYEGDDWLAPAAVKLKTPAEWDLGEPRTISGGAIQADHNDAYVISVSTDLATWRDAFFADPVAERGLRTRLLRGAPTTARFVRLRGEQGDGRFSVSEVELFDSPSASVLLAVHWLPSHPRDRQWLLLAALTVLALSLTRFKPRLGPFAVPAVALFALFVCWQTLSAPPSEERLTWLRAVIAGLAFATVLLEPATGSRWFIAVLGFCGLMGLLCFLNLGQPQFHDMAKNAPTHLHHYDMRTYFPIAKYFRELGFDGVYAASAMVVAEDRGGLDALASTSLRDLRDHEIRRVGDSQDFISQVRARFSPERWAQFRADIQYFRDAMGDGGFLGSMNDHGGNATPAWFLSARLLFGGLPASNHSLWLGVIADLALLLLAFASLRWAYGPRTAFIAMTVFGTMDFYLFGTNWFGAALRHDWLALWCLGVAFLKKERFILAGACLVWSAMIRAFPALTFVTLAAPLAWPLIRRQPLNVRAIRGLIIGAGGVGLMLLLASSVMFGFDAWPRWLHKVSMLNSSNHVNNIALKTYLVTEPLPWALLAMAIVGLVLVALRRAALDEAAAFGVALIGVVFNPANYYLHCLFILAVLRGEPERRRFSAVPWLALLGMCVGCYFTNLTTNLETHFRRETWVMLSALSVILVFQLARSLGPRPLESTGRVEPNIELR